MIKTDPVKEFFPPIIFREFKKYCREGDLKDLLSPKGLITSIKQKTLGELLKSFSNDEVTPYEDGKYALKHRLVLYKDAAKVPLGGFYVTFHSDMIDILKFTPNTLEFLQIRENIVIVGEVSQILYAQIVKQQFNHLTAKRHPKPQNFHFNSKILEGNLQRYNLTKFFESRLDVLDSLMTIETSRNSKIYTKHFPGKFTEPKKFTDIEKLFPNEVFSEFKKSCKESELGDLFSPKGIIITTKDKTLEDLEESINSLKIGKEITYNEGKDAIKIRFEFNIDAEGKLQGIIFMIFRPEKVSLLEVTPDKVKLLAIEEEVVTVTEHPLESYAFFSNIVFTQLKLTRHPKPENFSFNFKILEGKWKKHNLMKFFETNKKGYHSLMKG